MSAPAPEAAPHSVPPAPPRRQPLRLGEILVKAGVVTETDVTRAIETQKKAGGRLGSVLVSLHLCSEADIRAALRQQLGVEVVDLAEVAPDPSVLDLLPIDLVRRYEVIPLRLDGGQLTVAMLDPYNLAAIDDIRFSTGQSRLVVTTCTEGDFRRFLSRQLETRTLVDEILAGEDFYRRALDFVASGKEIEVEAGEEVSEEQIHVLQLESQQSPIVTLCNFVLVEAIRKRASDIHVEPYETFLRVRIRVDGRLRSLVTPPRRLHGPMLARLKVMSGLDIANRRIPQDGQLSVGYQGEKVDFRVSTLPTSFGEKCVLRLLRKEPSLAEIGRLGLPEDDLAALKTALSAPQGLLLVTGPTGSGKTTTLHAGLNFLNDGETNIVTLEDPVEASFAGVNHVPIHERGGVTFASGLRSILRQDPDIVFVGEMRDPEVSAIAIRAALTGHLVLSTLHTNSAIETLARLEDMAVPPYLLAASLLLVIAQRLLRRVCPECAEPAKADPEELAALGLSEEQAASSSLRRGKGCDHCLASGYYGRMAVYELLRVNGEVRDLIRRRAPAEEILARSRALGGRSLLEAGIAKALAGETTLAEVRRVLYQLD